MYCGGYELVVPKKPCSGSLGNVEVLSEEFHICLNFTFVPSMSLATFQRFIEEFEIILPDWGKFGKIDAVFYKIQDDVVVHALIRFAILKKKRSYKTLIMNINRWLARTGFVGTYEDEKIKVFQSLSDFCQFNEYNKTSNPKVVPQWMKLLLNDNENHQNARQWFNESDHVYLRLPTAKNPHFVFSFKPQISKLSFCKQVDLTETEFTLIQEDLLYITIHGQFLYENSFVVTRDLGANILKARICIDDFPYDEMRLSSGGLVNPNLSPCFLSHLVLFLNFLLRP